MSIVVLGDKLTDMQQGLLDRVAHIEAEKAQAVDRHTATTAAVNAAMRTAHNAYIDTLDAQIAAIKELIGE